MRGVKEISFAKFGNEDGLLISLEGNKNIPFDIRRVYYIFNTPSNISRGCHSHKNLQQVIICLHGSCNIIVDDGIDRSEVCLDNLETGLLIDGNIWREMRNFSYDCILVVLASEYYDIDDYVYNYQDFLEMINEKGS